MTAVLSRHLPHSNDVKDAKESKIRVLGDQIEHTLSQRNQHRTKMLGHEVCQS